MHVEVTVAGLWEKRVSCRSAYPCGVCVRDLEKCESEEVDVFRLSSASLYGV